MSIVEASFIPREQLIKESLPPLLKDLPPFPVPLEQFVSHNAQTLDEFLENQKVTVIDMRGKDMLPELRNPSSKSPLPNTLVIEDRINPVDPRIFVTIFGGDGVTEVCEAEFKAKTGLAMRIAQIATETSGIKQIVASYNDNGKFTGVARYFHTTVKGGWNQGVVWDQRNFSGYSKSPKYEAVIVGNRSGRPLWIYASDDPLTLTPDEKEYLETLISNMKQQSHKTQ